MRMQLQRNLQATVVCADPPNEKATLAKRSVANIKWNADGLRVTDV